MTLQVDYDERLTMRARALASSGNYQDWRAVLRKLLFDGYSIALFQANPGFIQQVSRICAESRRA